ncbi:histidine phosphatase family protein [Pelosinus sp. IPA-1]|uniref:histidine phosphatase family protein n=1 Tax=Pelosinus sp. IPA-1 TaxID=3029569 RepID=UPI0024362A54|nr:histidine phosphatase family protein [Pelosinus sp. IPA-1]GMA99150.1 hypothetical protein PIPA1_19500 [Pelosinus sp. IPA-1]
MLTKEDIKKARDFDDAAMEAGGYLDTTFEAPSYRLRDMYRWAREQGKDVENLTESERKQFLVGKKIWLIRHGESTANAGAITDNHKTISLSPAGQIQAEQISHSFQEAPALIITSPFTRTQQTAEPTIKRFPNVRCEVWSVEEFTYLSPETCRGTTAAERKERVSEYWERLDPDYVDGEGAESFSMLLSRAQTAIDRLSRLESGFIVMFTHAQFMRAMWVLSTNRGEDAKGLMNRFRELPQFNNCEIIKWKE